MAYHESLRLITIRPQTEAVMAEVRAWARERGIKWNRYVQSATFGVILGHQVELSGWHGAGKGNRNYGDSFAILSLYTPTGELRVLDVLKIDYVSSRSYFVDQQTKDDYLANLPKVMKALRGL
jgi:hypothetical protein